MRTVVTMVAICLLAASVPALAGEKSYKCDKDAEACVEAMAAKMKKKGWVGLELDKNKETGALTVKNVVADSPAEASGFKDGDVLTAFNGIAYAAENKEAMKKANKAMRPGQTVTYSVERDGKPVELTVKLSKIPETVMAQWIGQHMLMAHLDHDQDVPASSG